MDLTNKRVLVTGADGFIGSHLVELLAQEGADITALVHYNSLNSWGWLEEVECLNSIHVAVGDIRDVHFCKVVMEKIEVVFHLAALISIPYSYNAPDSFVDTNVKGTLNLCQAARAIGVEKFIHTSTSEVYGTAKYVPIDENHPLNPQSPYSATKIGADAIALSFYSAFQLPVVVARPFNTYGPRQSARAIIPTIISQIAAGAPEVQLGELTTTRDFTYIEDTCRGFLAIAKLDKCLGEVFNIGSNQEIAIGDLFSLISSIMQSELLSRRDEKRLRPVTSEVFRLRCDNTKLQRAAGFEPRIRLRDGLARTVTWFRDERNLRRYKQAIYNV